MQETVMQSRVSKVTIPRLHIVCYDVHEDVNKYPDFPPSQMFPVIANIIKSSL